MSNGLLSPVVLHNGSRILREDPLTVETAPERWAYAAQFDVDVSTFTEGEVTVSVELQVLRGEVGVGLLTADETAFQVERYVSAEDGNATILFTNRSNQRFVRLIVRNVDSARTSVVEIRALQAGTASSFAMAVPTLRIPSAIFEAFTCYDGPVQPGFWVNWLGVMTRADVWPFPPEVKAIYDQRRHERGEYPLRDEHVLDWVPMLQAILSARDVFRMVALGAGWGRWLTGGAFAARQRRLRFELTGVEAEPVHFAWMRQHMIDNDIPADCCRLIHGAASPSTDPCCFPVENPAWYGQSIVHTSETSGENARSKAALDGSPLQEVRAVPIEEALLEDRPVDYLHMDIQGTEYDFIARDPQRLTRLVRMVNIGTHSEAIERRLRRVFEGMQWIRVYDVAIGTSVQIILDDTSVARVEFGDGVQVWSNPHL